METLEYKDGRIYQVITKDITGEFDLEAEMARLTKERDQLTSKIEALQTATEDKVALEAAKEVIVK